MGKRRIGTREIAHLCNTTRQTARRWCALGWLESARLDRLGGVRIWTAEWGEVMGFTPPRSGPKPKEKSTLVNDSATESEA